MRFQFIDDVVTQSPDSIVAIKRVGPDEPALADHFPTFPILPGVIMLEVMIQAARQLIQQTNDQGDRYVLSAVKAIKYGAMVKPGMALRVSIERRGVADDGAIEFKGTGRAIPADQDPAAEPEDAPAAVSGRFTLRPVRVEAPLPSAS